MSVTFGTPVEVDYNNGATSVAFVMSGVTSGQPVIVVFSRPSNSTAPTSISDTFSTPYTWTVVDTETPGSGGYLRTYIGTGGVGTSGTITIVCPSASWVGGVAYPCIGASTAPGLAAIDVHGGSFGDTTESLTPTSAGEGAVYGVIDGNGSITNLGSPWVNTPILLIGSAGYGAAATYASPTSGSALAATWTNSGIPGYQAAVGLIVKAAAVASAKSALMAVTM